MTALTALWLPILLSAVIVFVISAMIHMLPLWHRNDYPALPNQPAVIDALRPLNLPTGDYSIPRAASMAEMRTPEFQETIKRGPVAVMTIRPNAMPSMARNLVLWFIYTLVISYYAAYIASRALPPGVDYLRVFQLAGAAAFAGYALALWQLSIWYYRSWSLTVKETVDGLIYALLTAGTFGWLWPR